MIKYIVVVFILVSCGSSNDPTDTYYHDDWEFTQIVWSNKVFLSGDTILIEKTTKTFIRKGITNAQAEDYSWNFHYVKSQSTDLSYYIQINFLTNKIKL